MKTHLRLIRSVRSSRGFALVVTLSLMILLTILAIGLLSLSSISLRSSSNSQLMQEARQNARLALMLAIGELQSTTGPDQRVTAPAQIRGTTALPPAQPHLTGVWQGWKWDGTSTADYEDKKESQFLRWLVSTRDTATASELSFAENAPTGDIVTLVKGNRIPAEIDQVDAQIVPINSNRNNISQGYAWTVFDESTKLPAALPEPGAKSLTASTNRMAAAPLPGYASTTERNWDSLGLMADKRLKLITPGQAGLEIAGVATADRGFHDLTSRSAGIAADAGKGGLAVDLSRLFSNPTTLPAEYKDRFLYSGTNVPLTPSPSRFPGANPFPSPDPSWRLLHSHYRMYDKLNGGLNPTLNTTTTPRPPSGTTGNAAQNDPFFQSQQIAPVIAKAQFVFSLSFAWHNFSFLPACRPGNDTLPDTDPNKDFYATWLVIDPIITLWNPYNVNLRFTGGRIDLYRMPLTFRVYKKPAPTVDMPITVYKCINRNGEYTHLANCFPNNLASQKSTYYRLNLLPPEGYPEIIMAPGEHIVLSAHNHKTHFQNKFSIEGVDLRPGFTAPAGKVSLDNPDGDKVGGVTTVTIFRNAAGNNWGRDYDPTNVHASVAVKPGDKIQVDVKAAPAPAVSSSTPPETGGIEVSGFLKYYTNVGTASTPSYSQIGGIELDYGSDLSTLLPEISRDKFPEIVVSGDIPTYGEIGGAAQGDIASAKPPVACAFKEPFLISTIQLKTERDSKFPSRSWIDNSPLNFYASAGLDQKEPWASHQYELQWEPMTDWPPATPTIEISPLNRGYGGQGIYAQSGLEFATHSSIPLAPALSLAQLRHAPLNTGGQLPLTSQIVGNSFASPLLGAASIRTLSGDRTLLDHSFLANSALFDQYFFSGLAEPGGPLAQTTTVTDAITGFFDTATPLPNSSRFIPHRGGRSTAEIAAALTAADGYRKTAAHLLIDSPFNVNSTRVDVWEALLGSTFGSDVPQFVNGNLISAEGTGAAISRHLPSNGADFESQTTPLSKWNGHRRLTAPQIRKLAEEIVEEVQSRGPFQSVAEFVNRRAEAGPHSQAGALQTAIERAEINNAVLDPAEDIPGDKGNTADGAPGVINQADILTPLAPILIARGDTFRIRAYGEAGPTGGTKVKAWCEAVVQRVPEYLDPSDEPWVNPPTNPGNLRFGRRYEIVSFRWLSPSEI